MKNVFIGLAVVLSIVALFMSRSGNDVDLSTYEAKVDSLQLELDTAYIVQRNIIMAVNGQAKTDSVHLVYVRGLYNILSTPYEDGLAPNYEQRTKEILEQINKPKVNETQDKTK